MREKAKSKILIVEDEGVVAKDIQGRLERLGYAVVGIAYSGDEAVETAGRLSPDLVLMDIKLRGDMDGIEAARQIRDSFNIPVIYLTAYTDDMTLKFAKIAEPYGYIVKPFGDRELHSNISMALYKHKAEKALRKSEERYRIIFDGSRDAIFIVAEDARFVEVNEAALALTGYLREELTKMTIPDLHEEEDTGAYKQFFHRIMSGEQITSEASILRKDRTKVDTEFSNRRITIGDVPYMHTVARDITERKKAEQAIQTLTESIAGTTGQEAFDKIVTNLCKWLDVEFAIVGQVVKEEQVNVLSMYSEGEIIHDYSYNLAGTPCDYVIQKGYCDYPENVHMQYPEDKDHVE